MRQASTAWREKVAPDEVAQFEHTSQVIAAMQRSRSARFGSGRSLHRKLLVAMSGTFEVAADLPEPARHGLFATPGRHRALVRLSNGGPDVQSNKAPDIRGFALKVLDVTGEAAMGGAADHQDFLMINHDSLPTPNIKEFTGFTEALIKGQGSALLHLFTAHGLGGGFQRLRGLFGALSRKFSGFATDRFNTVAPHAVGPYAARVRLKPVGAPAARDPKTDIAQDMRERLAKGPLAYDLELQFFVDEATTPIEDPRVAWPDAATPIVVVGRLTLDTVLDDKALESAKFDPWGGLAAHRPLGEIMRARKSAYFASQKGRGV
jgi:hypothetical protein